MPSSSTQERHMPRKNPKAIRKTAKKAAAKSKPAKSKPAPKGRGY